MFVELHDGKMTVGDRIKDRLAFDGWVTSTYHGLDFETVWECFAEGGDPILNVSTSNERSFFSALQQLDPVSVSLPTEQ